MKYSTTKLCSICPKKLYSKGYCRYHYERNRRFGSPTYLKPGRIINKGKICRNNECSQPAATKGLCESHYQSFKKHGRIYLIGNNFTIDLI